MDSWGTAPTKGNSGPGVPSVTTTEIAVLYLFVTPVNFNGLKH